MHATMIDFVSQFSTCNTRIAVTEGLLAVKLSCQGGPLGKEHQTRERPPPNWETTLSSGEGKTWSCQGSNSVPPAC